MAYDWQKPRYRYDMSSFSRLECWICDCDACPKLAWKGYKNHLSGARVGNRSKVHQWSSQPKNTHTYIYISIIFEDVWSWFSVQSDFLHIPQNFFFALAKKEGKEFNRYLQRFYCSLRSWGIPLSVRLRRRWWITSEAIDSWVMRGWSWWFTLWLFVT